MDLTERLSHYKLGEIIADYGKGFGIFHGTKHGKPICMYRVPLNEIYIRELFL